MDVSYNLWNLLLIKVPPSPTRLVCLVLLVGQSPETAPVFCHLMFGSSELQQQRIPLQYWGSLHSPTRRGGYCPRYQKGRKGQGTYFMIVLSGFSNIPNHNSSQIMPPCSILSGQCIVGTAHHSPSPKEAIHNPVLLPLPTASNTALPNLSSQKISK